MLFTMGNSWSIMSSYSHRHDLGLQGLKTGKLGPPQLTGEDFQKGFTLRLCTLGTSSIVLSSNSHRHDLGLQKLKTADLGPPQLTGEDF